MRSITVARKLRQHPSLGYLIALGLCAVAFALRGILGEQVATVALIAFFPAIALITFLHGLRTGVLTAVLTGVVGWYAFVPPLNSFALRWPLGFVTLALFTLTAAVILFVIYALNRSEGRLRATYDNAAVGILELDRDGRVLNVNEAHCKIMGRSRDELIGRRFTETTHPDDRDRDVALFRRQVEGELPIYTVEKQHLRPDGSLGWARVSSTPVRDAAGRFLYAVRIVEDVTERKRAEEALRASEGRLRATYDNAAVGIIEVDQDGRILQANQTHCELMGYSREEIVGHRFTDVTHPGDRDRDLELFRRQVKGELPVYTIEKQHIRADGAVRWARVSSTAVHDPAGHFYAVRVVEDITERKEAEIALQELNLSLERQVEARTREIERMAEENRRAAITRERLRIARDLHDTLANSIVGLLLQIRTARKQLTRLDPSTLPSTLESELAQAEESAREALAQARAAVGELRYQVTSQEGLGPALERLVARLRAKTSLEITLHVDPAAAGLEEGKAEVVYRIAEEALRNVERHSTAERVDVSLRADRLNGAERLTLTVADDGAGFDPGATPEGHYGLVGMREQAALIGAKLRLDSAPGQGTRVSISLPS